MKKPLLLIIASLLSAGAWANPTTLFQCTTTNNKIINLIENKRVISYSFGKQGNPELSIAVPKSKASTYQWSGIGRYINYAVNVPNGNVNYRVFSGFDKIDQTTESGVEVSKNGETIATVYCAPAKKITNNMEGVNLKSED